MSEDIQIHLQQFHLQLSIFLIDRLIPTDEKNRKREPTRHGRWVCCSVSGFGSCRNRATRESHQQYSCFLFFPQLPPLLPPAAVAVLRRLLRHPVVRPEQSPAPLPVFDSARIAQRLQNRAGTQRINQLKLNRPKSNRLIG